MDVAGFVVIPIPELGHLRLLDLIDRYSSSFDKSRRFLWKPIDNPRKTGPVYEQMRTPEQSRSDRDSIASWDSQVDRFGSENHYRRRASDDLATQLGIGPDDRPCLLFLSRPDFMDHPILRIPPVLLSSPEAADALARLLIESFTEQVVVDYLVDDVLTAESIIEFQRYLLSIEEQLTKMAIKVERNVPVRRQLSHGYLYMLIDFTGEQPITSKTRDDTLSAARRYDLLIDEERNVAFYRTGRRELNTTLTPLQCAVLLDVMACDHPVAPGRLAQRNNCATANAALKHFYMARSLIESLYRPPRKLFVGSRGSSSNMRRFHFCPPPDFKWAFIRPLNRCGDNCP